MDYLQKLTLESDYNGKNIRAFKLMKTNLHEDAIVLIKDLVLISKKLNDKKCELESTLNLGLCLFFTGKFLDSIEIFESAIRLCSGNLNYLLSLDVQVLKFRAYCNVTLACIACGNIQDASNYFTLLLNHFEKYSENPEVPNADKKSILKIIIYNFFGFESISGFMSTFEDLENYNEKNDSNDNKDKDDDNKANSHDKAIKKVIFSFYNMLLNYHKEMFDSDSKSIENLSGAIEAFNQWIKTLSVQKDSFKGLKDFNGFLFTSLNYSLSYLISKNAAIEKSSESKDKTEKRDNKLSPVSEPKDVKKEKKKLDAFLRIMLEEHNKKTKSNEDKVEVDDKDKKKKEKVELANDFSMEKVVEKFKNKLALSSEILKKLYSLEIEKGLHGDNLLLEINDLNEDFEKNENSDFNDIIQLKSKTEQKPEDNKSKKAEKIVNNNNIVNKETMSKEDQEKANISNKEIIKIFVKFAKSKLMNEIASENEDFFYNDSSSSNKKPFKNNIELVKQLEFVLELLETQEIDVSDIDLDTIDPDIFRSLRLLYINLCRIKYKSNISIFFKRLMLKTLGYSSRKNLRDYYQKLFKTLLQQKMNKTRDGAELTKFNYSSSGTKTHFYQISLDEQCLKIYEKAGALTYSKIYFSELKKFSYGICTKNMRSKSKTKDFEGIEPWNCFSLVTTQRTLDFSADEKEVEKWYFGFRYIFDQINVKGKALSKDFPLKQICSSSYYYFHKMKMKIFTQLRDLYAFATSETYGETEFKILKDVVVLVNNKGVESFTFLKLFLLLLRLKPDTIKEYKKPSLSFKKK